MINKVAGFDWDDANIDKCQKHGISTGEVEEIFINNPYWRPDAAHSIDEERFIAIGKLGNGKTAFVAFTFRLSTRGVLIRPISARYMHDREIKRYEKTIAEIQNR